MQGRVNQEMQSITWKTHCLFSTVPSYHLSGDQVLHQLFRHLTVGRLMETTRLKCVHRRKFEEYFWSYSAGTVIAHPLSVMELCIYMTNGTGLIKKMITERQVTREIRTLARISSIGQVQGPQLEEDML